MEKQIQQLIDLEDIRNLVRRYAHLVWQDKPLEAVDLFTEDGVVDMGPDGGKIEGRKALQAIYQEKVGYMMLHPFMHNHLIDLHGDKATGIAYLDLRCIRDGENLMGSGYYKDVYSRENGEWKFKLRELHMEYLVKPGANWR